MKAIRVHEIGGPERLRLDDVVLQAPGRGEVLVEVKASGVNFMDTQIRSGLFPRRLPAILGIEGAGIVRSVGEAVDDVAPEDRVAWILGGGSYTQYAIVPRALLVPLPASLGFAEAAAALFQGLTAHYLATSTYPLKPGESCLVHSAAGGVGTLLCQIAKRRGARVIGAVSTDAKAAAAAAAGADHVVVYGRTDVAAEARRLTDGAGVDVVYDAVGLATYEESLRALRRRGCLALYGEASGLVPPLDVRVLLRHGSLYLTRTGLDSYTATPEEYRARADELFGWLAEGSLRCDVFKSYPLADAAAAHSALESRATTGKLMIMPWE
jgi:NADPH2:quinone reductase